MDDRELIYYRLLLRQRRRYAEEGRTWPGSPPARAVSLYPNILAELDASGESLEKLAGYARVSPEIMAAVLEDGEELSARELRRLDYSLGTGGSGYLAAPTLQMVRPGTRRGAALFRRLDEMLTGAEDIRQSADVRDALGGGRSITYAEYRWACRRILEAQKKNGKKRKRIRAERRGGSSSCGIS